MKKCPNCGALVNEEHLFCTKCGNKFPQGNVCPHCGALVKDGDSFCQNCGHKVCNDCASNSNIQTIQIRTCKHCGAHIADGNRFCTKCGKPITQDKICPHCGTFVNEGNLFCQSCGKRIKEPQPSIENQNNESYIESNTSINSEESKYKCEEEAKKHWRKYLPYAIGIMVLIVICAGWWFLKNRESTEPLETTLVSFKKTAPSDNFDVETEIKVDFPTNGNPDLVKNIKDFVINALTNDFKNDESKQSPHYVGDNLDGQVIIDFYGNEKIKELQEQGIGEANISVLKTYETDWIVSYSVHFYGNNGNSAFGAKYGVSFNKVDGSTIQVINSPNNDDVKKYLMSKMQNYLKTTGNYNLVDESELRAHPLPNKAPYITNEGICFIYQKYEIGSGALGEIELTIPYNEIKPYISKNASDLIEKGKDMRQDDEKTENSKLNNGFLHNFNNEKETYHHLIGTFTDISGNYPVEISFSNRGNDVSNVIYI